MMWQVTDAEVVTKLGYSLKEFEEAVATEVSGASLAATLSQLDDIYNLVITSTTSPVSRDVLIDYVEKRDFRNFSAALILDDSTKWTVYSSDMNELSALISEMARLYQ